MVCPLRLAVGVKTAFFPPFCLLSLSLFLLLSLSLFSFSLSLSLSLSLSFSPYLCFIYGMPWVWSSAPSTRCRCSPGWLLAAMEPSRRKMCGRFSRPHRRLWEVSANLLLNFHLSCIIFHSASYQMLVLWAGNDSNKFCLTIQIKFVQFQQICLEIFFGTTAAEVWKPFLRWMDLCCGGLPHDSVALSKPPEEMFEKPDAPDLWLQQRDCTL